jgi:hypothetical protein
MPISRFMKRKNALLLALAAGIISFSVYGFYHTAYAYQDLKQSQGSSYILTAGATSEQKSPVAGGTSCRPGGCAGCSGCISLQYQENIEALPSSNNLSGTVY